MALTEPHFVDCDSGASKQSLELGEDGDTLAAVPDRLVQQYIVAPAKWRLVILLGTLRRYFGKT